MGNDLLSAQIHVLRRGAGADWLRHGLWWMLLWFAVIVTTAPPAAGHSLWLTTGPSGSGRCVAAFFGESPQERTYHFPDSLRELVIHQVVGAERAVVATNDVEEDAFIGLRSSEASLPQAVWEAQVTYGVYHGALLHYYAQHQAAWGAAHRATAEGGSAEAAPDHSESGLRIITHAATHHSPTAQVEVRWQGQPLPQASVALYPRAGDVVRLKTDEQGRVPVPVTAEEPLGVLASYTDANAHGEHAGTSYKSAMHIATLTFSESDLAPLPEAVSSFGAATSDGFVYVYGGHIGKAHDHSRDNLASGFVRRALTAGAAWESLPMGRPLQGLALVAHQGRIYRIGGLDARNPAGSTEDLHSVAECQVYDPETREWSALAALPEARSSHDAVVLEHRIYVMGGWKLSGNSDDGTWATHGLVLDLSAPAKGWEPLPAQPFQRRALAAATLAGRVVAIGGIDENGDISRSVDFYDPQAGVWSRGPDLPGVGMNGFGVAAWNHDGSLFVSGSDGTLYRLDQPDGEWVAAHRLRRPRFFHRLLPEGADALLAIGGASASGHLRDIERLSLVEPAP